MHHRTVLLAMVFAAVLAAGSPVLAGDTGERWGAGMDFKFMELRQQLRDHPTGDDALHNHFAIGEYYFSRNMPGPAAESFVHLSYAAPKSSEELLSAVYLVRCAFLMHNEKTVAHLKTNLQEALSSRQFVATFSPSREWDFRSPLGNHYHFREEVDRLEIQLNESPFYAINLS
jgi:hypothetical protein